MAEIFTDNIFLLVWSIAIEWMWILSNTHHNACNEQFSISCHIATFLFIVWSNEEFLESIIHNFVAFAFVSIIVIDVGYASVYDAIFGGKAGVQDP